MQQPCGCVQKHETVLAHDPMRSDYNQVIYTRQYINKHRGKICLWANNSIHLSPSPEIRDKSSAAALSAFAQLVLPWKQCSRKAASPRTGMGKVVGAVRKHPLTADGAAGWQRAHSQKGN